MSESSKFEQSKVVQLNPERNLTPHVALTRLPAAMHSLRDRARQQLQAMLRELFDRADDALFELADKATNNQEQNLYFDSMREVRIRRRSMEASFFRSIDISFAQLLDQNAYRSDASNAEKEISLDELSLVKNDELEELVATESMINKANDQFAEAIQHLTLRIDHLVPIKVYQKNNPLGVDVICNAFTDAAKAVRIDVKAKLVLFKLFDNLVMTKLGGLFQSLNQLLIEANILPSLKQGVRVKKPSTPQPAKPYGAGIGAGYQGEQGTGQAGGGNHYTQGRSGATYDEQTDQVLNTLRDLLGSRTASVSAPQLTGEEIASQDLINILSQAQQRNSAFSGNFSAPGASLNLREMLNELLRSEDKKAINQVDDDVINLVSMMFDFILDDRNLAAPMKALLGRLQIPMVKVAIADKSFFSKGGHPARRLLNEMAMAALGWQESSEENQRKDSLFKKMEEVVQTILSDFEADMNIFSTLLSDFRSFLDKDKRRAQILEQRTIDAEDGKAKSERARADVEAVLTSVLGTHQMPPAALKLLREAWANVMFITCLKYGTTSDEWHSVVNTSQQLVWSLTVPMNKENRQSLLKLIPTLLQKLRQGLEDISFNPFDATQLFKQLESLHLARLRGAAHNENRTTEKVVEATSNMMTEVASAPAIETPAVLHKEVVLVKADVISSDTHGDAVAVDDTTVVAEPELIDAAPETEFDSELSQPSLSQSPSHPSPHPESSISDAPAAQLSIAEEVNAAQRFVVMAPAAEEELAEGDQHLSLIANITQGSWFEMVGDGGQKFRCRLAAIIRPTGKYIFVNRSGMKVAEETRNSLALAMKSGRLRVLDDGMLFDRALEAVIGNLRQTRPTS